LQGCDTTMDAWRAWTYAGTLAPRGPLPIPKKRRIRLSCCMKQAFGWWMTNTARVGWRRVCTRVSPVRLPVTGIDECKVARGRANEQSPRHAGGYVMHHPAIGEMPSGRAFLSDVPSILTTVSGARRLGSHATPMTRWSYADIPRPRGASSVSRVYSLSTAPMESMSW